MAAGRTHLGPDEIRPLARRSDSMGWWWRLAFWLPPLLAWFQLVVVPRLDRGISWAGGRSPGRAGR